MLNRFMRFGLFLTAAICLPVALSLADGTPDPGMSTVDVVLVTCLAGQVGFEVTVRDDTGTPCAGVEVSIDFCDCPEATLCMYAGGQPCGNGKYDRLVANTDANGVALFFPAAGGICNGAQVPIVADGVVLAYRYIQAMDISGNFVQEYDEFTYDPLHNDYNGDGFVNFADLSIFSEHYYSYHTCDAPVSDEKHSWGSVKTLWR